MHSPDLSSLHGQHCSMSPPMPAPRLPLPRLWRRWLLSGTASRFPNPNPNPGANSRFYPFRFWPILAHTQPRPLTF